MDEVVGIGLLVEQSPRTHGAQRYTYLNPNDERRASGCKIGLSILNSDLASLGADYLHLDAFCSQHHLLVESLQNQLAQDPFFDMHMMVSRPEQWVKPTAVAGANQYTFHLEATENPAALIKDIRENGMKVGLAIKPGTTVEYLAPWAHQIDMALVMTVEAGFGGQKFMEDMMPKVHWLRTQFPSLDIEVDGGVDPDTIHKCAEAGANVIVSGSVIMSEDPRSVINLLRNVCLEAAQKRSLDRWNHKESSVSAYEI
ncbi:PREDICTED: ribulose-phosphate 3-epimerase-like [Lipotes vexillifer]|uniref:ribulose-phosphate 3-epimerase n=1 Tax=Lipotes vexillifer TaxID=118797 RepID=A0A340XYG6_LIPVE|nr:PREDICTED: ribulose-phosphate 3-epimerase-like [Lipotes vexillifer]